MTSQGEFTKEIVPYAFILFPKMEGLLEQNIFVPEIEMSTMEETKSYIPFKFTRIGFSKIEGNKSRAQTVDGHQNTFELE